MNKSELVHQVVEQTGHPAKVVGAVVDAVFDRISEAVARGEPAAFVGFGTFTAVARPGRTGRNPQTGEALQISGRTVPKFTPGSGFKAKVRNAN